MLKTTLLSFLFIGCFFGAQAFALDKTSGHSSEKAVNVTIEMSQLKSTDGQLLVAIYSSDDADGFPNDAKPVKTLIIKKITSSTVSASVALPPGTYAVSFIADENSNGKLDTGLFGIPKEGFGFSNNPAISFGAPSFSKCSVEVESAGQTIDMKAFYF